MSDTSEVSFGMNGFNLEHPQIQEIRKDILEGKHHFIVDFDAHFEEI